MESLNYAFRFVEDVYIKITNPSGGRAKLNQDYYKKKTHTVNIHDHEPNAIN